MSGLPLVVSACHRVAHPQCPGRDVHQPPAHGSRCESPHHGGSNRDALPARRRRVRSRHCCAVVCLSLRLNAPCGPPCVLPSCRPHTRPHRVARNSTVAGAAAELVAALQLIMKLPRSECGPTNRYIHFVLRNRFELHESFHDALVSEGGGGLVVSHRSRRMRLSPRQREVLVQPRDEDRAHGWGSSVACRGNTGRAQLVVNVYEH